MLAMQQNQTAATARRVQRQQEREDREATLEEQLMNIQWPENGMPMPNFVRRNSTRETLLANRCIGQMREAYSMQSVGACGTTQDDYQTLHRTSGSLRPRPSTIHESTAPSGTYARVEARE